MTATRVTLPVLPRRRRPRWKKCWWMPSCRITDNAAMYSDWHTAARPPRTDRLPRLWPLSRDHGASLTCEVEAWLSRCLHAGRKATSMAAVREPTPGTLRYRMACGRESLHCHRAWYAWYSRAISWSSQVMYSRGDQLTATLTPLDLFGATAIVRGVLYGVAVPCSTVATAAPSC